MKMNYLLEISPPAKRAVFRQFINRDLIQKSDPATAEYFLTTFPELFDPKEIETLFLKHYPINSALSFILYNTFGDKFTRKTQNDFFIHMFKNMTRVGIESIKFDYSMVTDNRELLKEVFCAAKDEAVLEKLISIIKNRSIKNDLLELALKTERETKVRLLLEAKANPKLHLHIAVEKWSINNLKMLIEAKADVTKSPRLLEQVIIKPDLEMLDVLIEAKADPTRTPSTRNGKNNFLELAIVNQNIDLVKKLLDYGVTYDNALSDAFDRIKNFIVDEGDLLIIKLLLDYGYTPSNKFMKEIREIKKPVVKKFVTRHLKRFINTI